MRKRPTFGGFASWVLALAVLAMAPLARAQAPETVVYPRAESEKDGRDDYPVRLLALALSKSGGNYQLRAHPNFMLQVRAIAELQSGRNLDVIWTTTSNEREAQLLPVRIPIDRGLLGWRLLLVREADASKFAGISDAGLQQLLAGQGHDWPDTGILKSAGYRVDVSSNYRDLFLMLGNKSIDYFPRSTHEVWGELDLHRDKRFIVEPTLALHYPAAMYFFVNRINVSLQRAIQRGLEAAIADGSFERLFQEHFSGVLKRSGLEGRRTIELNNPQLPPLTPLQDQRLWLQVKPKAAPAAKKPS